MLLERAGYRVFTALDGATGLEIFAREPIQAVVLDFAMPDVPILMLSAYTSLPPEVHSLVNMTMTKGEGAPSLLKKLGSLVDGDASQ